jgi:hypothetical protein
MKTIYKLLLGLPTYDDVKVIAAKRYEPKYNFNTCDPFDIEEEKEMTSEELRVAAEKIYSKPNLQKNKIN